MKTKLFIVILLLLVSTAAAYRYDETIEKTFSTQMEGSLKLSNINGSIKIETHKDGKIEIKAVKKANSRNEFAKIEIQFEAGEDSLTVTAQKKEKDCKVNVDFYLKVPEKLRSVDLLTILGSIEAEGEYRELKLKTVNGHIDFEGNFTGAGFSTVSEDITLYIEEELAGDVQAGTYNGDIKIVLDSDSEFTIEAAAVNGRIENRFRLLPGKVSTRRELKGKVKNGRHKVYLKSQNGNIRILRY